MTRLSDAQRQAFARDGYLVAEEAVSPAQLAALRRQLDAWIEESRGHRAPYGETIDNLPRFDIAKEHRAEAPALRRVNNPAEVSECYAEVAFDSALVDMVADLIGPDVKFHHSKLNIKLPHTATRVDYHQDFSYTPHSNDDMVTALLLLDDVTSENGCLMVVPGSHREGQKSLWQGDRFTGKVDPETEREAMRRAVPATGKAGSVCLMHTQLLHGSAANASDRRRTLFIAVYTAADALPLARSPLPNRDEGRILRGVPARSVRLMGGEIELPEDFRAASFFEIQERAAS
ncbi:MAG: phytanoyl-CoA dioxygenase family protein [Kiloniellales bacterium]